MKHAFICIYNITMKRAHCAHEFVQVKRERDEREQPSYKNGIEIAVCVNKI